MTIACGVIQFGSGMKNSIIVAISSHYLNFHFSPTLWCLKVTVLVLGLYNTKSKAPEGQGPSFIQLCVPTTRTMSSIQRALHK
jgi:hypothetical protein